MLTRIDLSAQKELEGGRDLKKLEIIWIFREKSEKWQNSGFGVVLSRVLTGEFKNDKKSLVRFLLGM